MVALHKIGDIFRIAKSACSASDFYCFSSDCQNLSTARSFCEVTPNLSELSELV